MHMVGMFGLTCLFPLINTNLISHLIRGGAVFQANQIHRTR